MLLDSRDVILREVEVPAGASRQLSTMLPFLLEEDVAQDVDELHFSILKQTSDTAWTAAVDRDYLASCVESFEQAGIELNRIVPDVLVLPNIDSDITILPFADHFLVRNHEFSGFSIQQSLLPVASKMAPFVTEINESDEEEQQEAKSLVLIASI